MSDKPTQRRRSQRLDDPIKVDRLPPHSMEAEQGILGCIMSAPGDCIPDCLERIKSDDLFYDLRHRTIYSALMRLHRQDSAIDLITIHNTLKAQGQVEGAGGLAYISSLPDTTPSAANLSYYLGIALELYRRRIMIAACTELVGRAYDQAEAPADLLSDFDQTARELISAEVGQTDLTIGEAVHEAIATIEGYHAHAGTLPGLPTGFIDLDKLTGGLHAGELTVLAARPSIGKTSLLCNIAEHLSIIHKIGVGIFSLEMQKKSLVMRLLCSLARVNPQNIRDGFLADRDFPKLTNSAGKLFKAPILIDDRSDTTLLEFTVRARRMVREHGAKVIALDYLQLMDAGVRDRRQNFDSRQREVSEISRGCKKLAKDLAVPVIALSQLNRDMEKDRSRKPRLSDLRESGSLEQDADNVWLLYKGKREDDGEGERDAGPVNLILAKQRNGPTDEVKLTFLRGYTRFESAARISTEDLPTQQEFQP